MRRNLTAWVHLSAWVLSIPSLGDSAATFDTPVEVKRIDLGAKNNSEPECHRRLTCFYFDQYMVRQLGDYTGKNCDKDDWYPQKVSILPIPKDVVRPACKEEHATKEIRIVTQNPLAPIFVGAKSNYVFMDGGQSEHGFWELDVFDARNGRKLFDDTVDGREGSDDSKFTSLETHGAALTVRYKRVYDAECTVPAGGHECWAKVMKETGLEHSDMPTDCGCFLDRGHCKRQGDHWKCDAACTTMLEGTYGIGYDVEAVFDGSKLNVTPVHGQTDCWEYN